MLRFGLGSAYFNDRNYEASIPHLESCLQYDPGYTAAYKLLGKAYYKTRDPEKAKSVFATGLPIAVEKGDKQTEREILAFLKKV